MSQDPFAAFGVEDDTFTLPEELRLLRQPTSPVGTVLTITRTSAGRVLLLDGRGGVIMSLDCGATLDVDDLTARIALILKSLGKGS